MGRRFKPLTAGADRRTFLPVVGREFDAPDVLGFAELDSDFVEFLGGKFVPEPYHVPFGRATEGAIFNGNLCSQ